MLCLYGGLKVPGVDHVQLYRDDENPHKFYMMTARPTIARDSDGKPLFTFMLYARDADRLDPKDLEVQRGYLAMSTQAGVTAEDEKKIRAYLKTLLNGEVNRRYAYLGRVVTQVEPILDYPPMFTEGSVEFETFSTSLDRHATAPNKPSLIGANVASFSSNLNQEDSEVFRQAVLQGILPAIVRYSLKFVATIPAIKIDIHGDLHDFYSEIKEHIRVTETQSKNGRVVHRKSWLEIGSLKEFRSTFRSIEVSIDDRDFRDDDASKDAKQKLEEMAFTMLQTNILPMVFREVPEGASAEQSKDKWLMQMEKELHGRIDVSIKKSAAITQSIYPNAQLTQILTPAEVAANTVYIDLSNPYFRELDVRVNTNVNFKDDPVFAVKVFLDYNQQDDIRNTRVTQAKELMFKTADEVQRFRKVMAKDKDGAPKDSYKYWHQIFYKDSGKSIRVPATGALESRERELVVSYERLGFVRVALMLGEMPDSVKSVQVQMTYPGSTQPAAQQTFELTREKRTATFFTYTGEMLDTRKPYRYTLSYRLLDGQRMDLPEQTGQAELLTITDPFEQTVQTRFLAAADFSLVDKIIVDANYRDTANDFSDAFHAEMSSNGESATWVMSLRDPKKREMDYQVTILYKNGSKESKSIVKGEVGHGTIDIGGGASDALDITIAPVDIDWSIYKLVLVYLKYSDPTNDLLVEKNFIIKSETGDMEQSWRVLLKDKQQKSYQYRLRYVGMSPTDNKEVTWQPTEDPVLVVQNP